MFSKIGIQPFENYYQMIKKQVKGKRGQSKFFSDLLIHLEILKTFYLNTLVLKYIDFGA